LIIQEGVWDCKIPLQRAVDGNRSTIVYYFVKEYNQDISKLDQVTNYFMQLLYVYVRMLYNYIHT